MTGAELVADINACRVEHRQCGLWWLGQHSFVVKLGEATAWIDPFLTDLPEREVPPLVDATEVAGARLVLGSHDHADHIDRPAWPAIAASSPEAVFIVPALLRERLLDELPLDGERIIGIDEDRPVTVGGLTIAAVPAAHEFLDTDAASGLHPYLGFIIEGPGFRLYHAGDTCLWEGLHERLRRRGPLDLMILPINGRDGRRLAAGCIGNMTFQEAADLAGALRPGTVIPAHYEMFAGNTADVGEFVDYVRVKYPDQAVVVPCHGQRVILDARSET